MNLHHVVEAIGILVSGLLFYSYTYSWLPTTRPGTRLWRGLLNGAAFGALAIVLMISRIEIAPDVFVDARAVPVALIGLFEGWPAVIVASAMAAGYRLWLGGGGAWAGVLTLALTGIAAGLVHALARRAGRVTAHHTVFLAGLTIFATFAGFTMLGDRGIRLLGPVWSTYMLMLAAGIVAFGRLLSDVGEQHRLAAAQQRYRDILDEATDVIRIIDPDSLRIIDTNRADSALSGYSRDEILVRNARDFWPAEPDAASGREATLAELRRTGHAQALGVGYRTRSGAVVPIDATYRLLNYRGRRYAIVIMRNAGHRLAAEATEREAAELRAATLLARAAAHEIHNPLAVILGYLQLLQPRMTAGTKEAGWVQQMIEATARIRAAVDRLSNLIRIERTVDQGLAPAMLDTRRSVAQPEAAPASRPVEGER